MVEEKKRRERARERETEREMDGRKDRPKTGREQMRISLEEEEEE